MRFKTSDLQYSSRAKPPANGAEPWAAAKMHKVGRQKKGLVTYGRRGLAVTLAVVLKYTVWKPSLRNKLLFPSLLNSNVNGVSQCWVSEPAGSVRAGRLGGYGGTPNGCEHEIETDQDKYFWKADHKVDLEMNAAFCCSAGFPGEGKCWLWKGLWAKGRTGRREPKEQPGLQPLTRHNSTSKVHRTSQGELACWYGYIDGWCPLS